MPTVDVRARDAARAQHGRATRRQLHEAGVSRATVARRLAAGTWTEPVPGVIDLRTHAPTWRAEVTQVVLAAGPDAWACGPTAAHLHRLLDAPRPARPHVLVPRRRHRRVGEVRLHSTHAIGADEITSQRGLPCTTVARTLLDLAPHRSVEQLERWLADATRRDAGLPERVQALLDRHRRAAGRRRLGEALARLPTGVYLLGSPLEVLGVQRLVALGAPPFELQYVVRDAGGARVKRVDVAWPDRRTLVEFDGAAYHDLVGARADDERTRTRLRALGWRVEVVRREDLEGPRLGHLVAALRA